MNVKHTRRGSAALKWHGGKSYLAAKVIALIPQHIHYVEPFFGGGAVLFAKPPQLIEDHSEVVNDVFGELMNFWRVLQSKRDFSKFEKQVALIPFAAPEWDAAVNCDATDAVSRALAFFVRYRQSRQGLGRDFATLSRTRTRRGMNEQVSAWLSAIDGLADTHARLRRVVIQCMDAIALIKREDDMTTFFYCDPPYVSSTRVVKRAYTHEMTTDEHVKLLDTLEHIRGKFLLSGYANTLYDERATKCGWRRVDIKIDNKASAKKIKPRKTECIWANY